MQLKLLILVGDGAAVVAEVDFIEMVFLLWLVVAFVVDVGLVYLVYPSLVGVVFYFVVEVVLVRWLLLEAGVVVE